MSGFSFPFVEADYTPALTFSATTPGDMTGTFIGHYQRHGRLILFNARIILTSKGTGGSGNVRIGIPAVAAATFSPNCGVYTSAIDFTANYTYPFCNVVAGQAYCHLQQGGDNQVSANLTWALIANTSIIDVAGFYWAA